MPTITPPTYEDLFNRLKSALEPLGFTHWSEGSRIGAICRVQAAMLYELWQALAVSVEQINPSTARGIYLDRLGEQFGVRRLPPQAATTVGKGPAVKFTNTGSVSVTIPMGTRVWSSADPDIAFFTVADLTLAAGGEGFVDVIAARAGELFNIGTGVLDAHNAGMASVRVTNVRPIGGGTMAESDDSYRFRIKEALQARNGATEIAIRQAVLKIPGVRDVIVYSGVRGNGSVDVLVIPIDRYASVELIAAAELAVSEVVAAGISWRVRVPVPRRVDVQVQLRLAGGANIQEVRSFVESAVRGYIDNLRVEDGRGGSELIYNELVSRVQDAHPAIIDSAINLLVDGVPTLQTNLAPKPGERFISGSVSVS